MKAVVSVVGQDKVGIIGAVAAELASCNVNILDISQTTLQEFFAMIMLVELEKANLTFDDLQVRMQALGTRMNQSIRVQRQDLFDAMYKV